MQRVMAVNGSPSMEKGSTEMILARFLQGMRDAGAETETVYPSRLNLKPCNCNVMRCWYKHPGECLHGDDMRGLYARLRATDILVLATPVYVPLPGAMQDFVNRLVPLMDPVVVTRAGRTRARLRSDVRIAKLVLVSTGAWWEKENFDTVVHIAAEFAENLSIEYAGAVLRPHVEVMTRDGRLTADGEAVMRAVAEAGRELVEKGALRGATLEAVSRPLVSRETYLRWFNQSAAAVGEDDTD